MGDLEHWEKKSKENNKKKDAPVKPLFSNVDVIKSCWSCGHHPASLELMPTVPIVGVGKEGRTLIGPWGYLNRKLPFIELPWELLALCRFSVVNAIGNTVAWPDKLGTSPMAHVGSNVNRSGRQGGEVESRKYAPDSAWVWRMSGLARDWTTESNSRDWSLGCKRGRKILFPPVKLNISRIGNHTRLMPSLLKVMTTHTHSIRAGLFQWPCYGNI